jgi:hypothetical protein
MTTRRFLFVSADVALIGDLAWQVSREGHEVKYYIEAASDREIADGFVPKTDDWEAEVDWADVIVFDDIWVPGADGEAEEGSSRILRSSSFRLTEAGMFEGKPAAGPGAFGVMIQAGVFPGQIHNGIAAFIDVKLQPITVNAGFGDADSGGQPSAMIASGAISGYEGGDQPIRQAALSFFVSRGHGGDHFTAHQGVALAGVITAAHGPPIDTRRIRLGRATICRATAEVDDCELPFIPTGIIPEKLGQDGFREVPLFQKVQGFGTPFRVMLVLGAKGAHAGARVRNDTPYGRIFAGHRGAADSGGGIDRDDGKGVGNTKTRMQLGDGAL